MTDAQNQHRNVDICDAALLQIPNEYSPTIFMDIVLAFLAIVVELHFATPRASERLSPYP